MATTVSTSIAWGAAEVRPPLGGLRVVGGNKFHRFADYFTGSSRPITVGRTRHRDIRIRDDSVSKFHCQIERASDGSYLVRDCDSYNGVRVALFGGLYGDFQPVSWHPLGFGMYLRLGDAIVIPVDDHGWAPIWAIRKSEFMRDAYDIYGSYRDVHDAIGGSYKKVKEALMRLGKAIRR